MFEYFGVKWVGRPRTSSCILASMGTLSGNKALSTECVKCFIYQFISIGVVVDYGHHSCEIETVSDGFINISRRCFH